MTMVTMMAMATTIAIACEDRDHDHDHEKDEDEEGEGEGAGGDHHVDEEEGDDDCVSRLPLANIHRAEAMADCSLPPCCILARHWVLAAALPVLC